MNDKKLKKLKETAERILKNRKIDVPEADINELNDILHELHVYQIELEIQNEELRRTQNELELSKSNYARLFEFAPDGFVILDKSGIIQRTNITFANLVGYDKPQIVHQAFSQFIHDEDKHYFLSKFRSFFQKPAGKSFEIRLKNKREETLSVRIHASEDAFKIKKIADEEEPQPLLLLSVSDITAQKKAEERNRQIEENMRQIIENTPAGVCITDPNGLFEYVNSSYCRIYGYVRKELIGKHFTIVVPDNQKKTLSQLHDHFIAGRREIRGEWNVINKSGENLTILADAAKITGNDGEPRKVTFVMDITEKTRLEVMKEDVERIMRHDLKTPLNGIIGFPQLILMDDNLTEEQIDYLHMIETSGKKMRDMINLSLDMYKMETGSYKLEAVPVDVAAVIRDCIIDLATIANAKEVKIGFNAGDEQQPIILLGESLLCYSLFSNLILNAIEASPLKENVAITISTDKMITVTIHNKGAVPPNLRKTFFDKYTTHNSKKGTGLGTYSARLYAGIQGGDIAMTTSTSEGTYVFVTFPIPDLD